MFDTILAGLSTAFIAPAAFIARLFYFIAADLVFLPLAYDSAEASALKNFVIPMTRVVPATVPH